jgi:Cd2+/Zn2+-exporting ATPase
LSENKSKTKRITLTIGGLHCADCALSLEKMLAHLKGVREANLNYIYETATISYDPDLTAPGDIMRAIGRPGYQIAEMKTEHPSFLAEHYESLLLIVVGVLLLSGWIIGHFPSLKLLSIVFTLAGALTAIYPIARSAVATLLGRSLNVDVLVTLAVIAALITGKYLEAGLVAFIMLLGEVLEDFTADRTRLAIRKLLDIGPTQARLIRDGKEISVPAAEVRAGDRIIVKPGERIPVDGVIIYGEASINEAAITGEYLPADKVAGAVVFTGTVVESGALEVEATKVGEDTTLARIRTLVQDAQQKKAPVQRIMDRYAAWFVPTVIALALGVWGFTGSITQAITVLVVACPCALVLATPTAVVAGIGSAAGKGVLIKGGSYLERAGEVNAVAFDKTGTLTTGRVTVAGVVPAEGYQKEDVFLIALEAERLSEHPLARAILVEAKRKGISPRKLRTEFKSRRGLGIEAVIEGQLVLIGNRRLMLDKGWTIPYDMEEALRVHERKGETPVIVGREGQIMGIITFSDTMRPEAKEAVSRLKRLGTCRIIMLTGDNPHTASAIAEHLGIDFRANLLPEEKVEAVNDLKRHYRVAMVGDGINDAPALAQADLGIAMGAAGSDIAIEVADIALMADDLTKVATAIDLSRRSLSRIRYNFIFAVVFNVGAIILAATGIIGLITGAVLHQFSSLAVILNSALLLAYKER